MHCFRNCFRGCRVGSGDRIVTEIELAVRHMHMAVDARGLQHCGPEHPSLSRVPGGLRLYQCHLHSRGKQFTDTRGCGENSYAKMDISCGIKTRLIKLHKRPRSKTVFRHHPSGPRRLAQAPVKRDALPPQKTTGARPPSSSGQYRPAKVPG